MFSERACCKGISTALRKGGTRRGSALGKLFGKSPVWRQVSLRYGEKVRSWYDAEGDYLEVISDQTAGCFRETESDRVMEMEKVDEAGNILGFSVLKASALKRPGPLEVVL